MKEFTLNANAWHFRLANFGRERLDEYDVRHGTDICTYTRFVIRGLVSLLARVLAICVAAAWLLFTAYDVVNALSTGAELHKASVALLIVLGTVIFSFAGGAAWYFGDQYIRQRRLRSTKVSQPGFITLAYRKFKNKTCFKIKFEDQ